MATSTGNFVCDNSTLANFKSWAQAISNAFSAFGWTLTADTGQVNWTSIAAVPSSTFVYEVWKAADALAATMPIFVKVQYGFSATNPRLQITVGTGSDGAGNITGQIISAAPWNLTGTGITNQGSTTFPCFFSGSASEFRMYMWSVTSGTPTIATFLVIERSKDASGNNTAEYVTVVGGGVSGGGILAQQTITATGIGNKDGGCIALAGSSGAGTGLAFGTVAAFPAFPILGKVGNPMLGVMTAYAADVANNSIVTVTSMYGSTHTFVGVSPGTGLSTFFGSRTSSSANMAGLMRYE